MGTIKNEDEYFLAQADVKDLAYDRRDRREQITYRVMAIAISASVAIIIGLLSLMTNAAFNRDSARNQALQSACIQQGGIYTNASCQWSKP